MSELKRRLKARLKFEVENFIMDNFQSESFGGVPWKKRKSRDRSDRRSPGSRRALLVKSGAMRRSMRVMITTKGVQVVSDLPYTKIHNEGGVINHPGGTPYITTGKTSRARGRRARLRNFGTNQVQFMKKDGSYPPGTQFTRPHKIEIPQRQIIGESPKLNKNIKKGFEKELYRYFEERLGGE